MWQRHLCRQPAIEKNRLAGQELRSIGQHIGRSVSYIHQYTSAQTTR
jgi:hypothetical protein